MCQFDELEKVNILCWYPTIDSKFEDIGKGVKELYDKGPVLDPEELRWISGEGEGKYKSDGLHKGVGCLSDYISINSN